MHSILIISKNRESALEKAIDICKQNKINDIDITIENFEKIIGIDDIRNMQKKLFLKPFRSKIKSVIIDSFPGITLEAQNALLKILEEPPSNTVILLIAENSSQFLPTILSRCRLIEIKEKIQFSDELILEYQKKITEIARAGIGKKLKIAQDYGKSRKEALIWLEKMLFAIRKIMLDSVNSSAKDKQAFYLNALKNFQKTYTIIKTSNVNQRFALEDLFLKI